MSKAALLLEGIRQQTTGDVPGAIQTYRRALPHARALLGVDTPDGGQVFGPDFLVIGAARCGTSWLKKRLSGHPAVRILAGEPNYFSFEASLDPRAYIARYASDADLKAPGLSNYGRRRVYGEKSPSYLLMSHTKIALLKALFPDVKIIILTREPVERGWSDIRRRTEDFDNIPDLPLILRTGHYAEHVKRWATHFPPEQMLFIPFENIHTRPERVFAKTLKFLGLETLKTKSGFPEPPPPPPQIPPPVLAMLEAEYAGEPWLAKEMRALAAATWTEQQARLLAKGKASA